MNVNRINKIRNLQNKGLVRGTHFTIDVWVDPEVYDLENLEDEALENLEAEIQNLLETFCASVIVRPGVDYTL